MTSGEKEQVAWEARQALWQLSSGVVTDTTSEAAELYHRVEPLVFGSAHTEGCNLLRRRPAVAKSRGSRVELTREAIEGIEAGASLSELKTSFLSAMRTQMWRR